MSSYDSMKQWNRRLEMRENWVALNRQERELLVKALRKFNGANSEKSGLLIAKLLCGQAHPKITIGVHGGQLQWILGNPFPIRVCDYDGESKDDLPDVDERGQNCRMWFEPVDSSKLT
jgi:hypothetical protein